MEEPDRNCVPNRPTVRGLLIATLAVACCLSVFRIGVISHSDFLGGWGLWGSIVAIGAAFGYCTAGRNGIVGGVMVSILLAIVCALLFN